MCLPYFAPVPSLKWPYPKLVTERENSHTWIMEIWVFMIILENGGGILVMLKLTNLFVSERFTDDFELRFKS